MDLAGPAAISEAGTGSLFDLFWLVRAVLELFKHPVIGIPVGILLICVLIVGLVRIVQMLRGKI
jgi:hypothetical protein